MISRQAVVRFHRAIAPHLFGNRILDVGAAEGDLGAALAGDGHDVNRPSSHHTEEHRARASGVSVIIPALNEAEVLDENLRMVAAGRPHEIIVVDGGSRDSTRDIATAHGATVLESAPGRARQMNCGAKQASGDVLLFLHADTRLPLDWPEAIRSTLATTGTVAGAFGFKTDGCFAGQALLERATNFRSRRFQMPYGDQALFLSRSTFEALSGFSDLPIMEDYEFARRLRRRGKVAISSAKVLTSARRWRSLGVVRTVILNQLIIAGYHLGVTPSRLARWYRGEPSD